MSDVIYERLAEALDRLPNGFPRTPSGVEIPMLKKIFSEQDAIIASQMGRALETVDEIAGRTGYPLADMKLLLKDMARRGLVWFGKKGSTPGYRLAPFIVGIFEEHLFEMDHEFAHLYEAYMSEGGAKGIMQPVPALHRVVPARGSVKTEYILPYDDVRAMLDKAISFRVRDCICRKQKELIDDRSCDFPMKMCLNFTTFQRPENDNTVTKEGALKILNEAEEVGLVHTVSNVMKGVYYVCNCCGCCCGILRGITEWGIQGSVAYANYCARIDRDACTDCGTCMDRCQVQAIADEDGQTVIIPDRCIGCGLCITGCPSEAIELIKRPDAELVHPPEDFEAWEILRLKNRGVV
ncbi:4Fe-4S binding protein [candidate division WOR-3 bacterium]|nr:4Fe-4S binding protein [candidate division WOR-3 bacterium]